MPEAASAPWLAALAAAVPGLDARTTAEALWLAAIGAAEPVPQPDDAPKPPAPSPDGPSGPAAAPPSPVPERDPGDATAADRPEAGADGDTPVPAGAPPIPLSVQSADGTHLQSGTPVMLPRARPLPDALGLGRALRPFTTKWLNGSHSQLDVESTVDHYARSGRLLPMFTPAPERRLDVSVVVDRSASMAVWAETAEALTALLSGLGAFRDVRTLYLSWNEAEPRLLDHLERPVSAERAARLGRSPQGRKLILVVTDAAAAGWRRPAVWQLLRAWSQAAATALVDPLPMRLWRRSALDLPAVRVGSTVVGGANTTLHYRLPLRLRTRDERTRDWLPLPVVAFAPHSVGRWSRAIMRSDPHGCDAVLVPDGGRAVTKRPSKRRTDPSAAERAESFLRTASTPAARLAVLCAPFTRISLPMLHLLREQAVPEAELADLAELVVSGMFALGSGPRQEVELAFEDGVQAQLLTHLTVHDSWSTYHALTRHISMNPRAPGGVAAIAHTPDGMAMLPAGLHIFAEAAADVLRTLKVTGQPRPVAAAPPPPLSTPFATPITRPSTRPAPSPPEARESSGPLSGDLFSITVQAEAYPPISRAVESAHEVARRFHRLGLATRSTLDGDGSAADLHTRLERWRPPPDRTLVLHWTGHTAPSPHERDGLLLLCRDTPNPIPLRGMRALGVRMLGNILARKQLRRLVVILDGGDASGGARDFADGYQSAYEELPHAAHERMDMSVICLAGPIRQASHGALNDALLEVLSSGAPSTLSEEGLAAWLTDSLQRVCRKRNDPGLLVENAHVGGAVRTSAPLDRTHSEPADVPSSLRTHATTRDASTWEWPFLGRQETLLQISDWLNSSESGVFILTGPSGSGKSTVLRELDRAKAFVDARGRTATECEREIADRLGVAAGGGPGLDEAIAGRRDSGEPILLIFDALDEGEPRDAEEIAVGLAGRLAAAGAKCLIAIPAGYSPVPFGWSATIVERLSHELGRSRVIVHDLRNDPNTEANIAALIRRSLANAALWSSFEAHGPAQLLARYSEGNFLKAQTLSEVFIQRAKASPGLGISALYESMRDMTLAEAFDELLRRFGADEERVRALLQPLAWTWSGAALPVGRIWQHLAVALARPLDGSRREAALSAYEADIGYFMPAIRPYLIEASGTDGTRTFRLYHNAFAAHLRRRWDPGTAQRIITDALLVATPSDGQGRRDWNRAEPYLLQHLADHAAIGGRLAELVKDPGFLVHADPVRLMRYSGITRTAGSLPSVYFRLIDRMAKLAPPDRAALLLEAARRDHPELVSTLEYLPELSSAADPLPDPARSRAVLIGVDLSPSGALLDLPSAQHDLRAIANLLAGRDGWALPPEHRIMLNNPAASNIRSALNTAATSATDMLFVYVVGRCAIEARSGRLLLVTTPTDPAVPSAPALPLADLIERLNTSGANRILVVIDCVLDDESAHRLGTSDIMAGLPSARSNSHLVLAIGGARAQDGDGARRSALATEIIDLIRSGLPGASEYIDASTLFREARRTLTHAGSDYRIFERSHVESSASGVGAIFRNKAWNPTTTIYPPPEVEALGEEALAAFNRAKRMASTQVWTAKALLVGEAGAGKTSVLRALQDEPSDPASPQTHGIRVHSLSLPHPQQPYVKMRLNAWDFGGLQLYHHGPRRPLLAGSGKLLLLVWNGRTGDADARLFDWLNLITALVPDAPVIIVVTHADEAHPDLSDVLALYRQVTSVISVDTRTGSGIAELRGALAAATAQLPSVGATWPTAWWEAAENVRSAPPAWTTSERMHALMAEAGLHDAADRAALAMIMHQDGDILYYPDDPRLADFVVLQPSWVDGYIDRVLDNRRVVERDGVLRQDDIDLLWSELDGGLRELLLHLMSRYNLAYRLDTDQMAYGEASYQIATLLPRRSPNYQERWAAAGPLTSATELRLVHRLSLPLPDVLPQFITRTREFSTDLQWRYGVLLSRPSGSAIALVRADEAGDRIELTLRGSDSHDFCAKLDETLTELYTQYPGISVERVVPCPCDGDSGAAGCDTLYPQAALLRALARHRSWIECPRTGVLIELRRLLGGLTSGRPTHPRIFTLSPTGGRRIGTGNRYELRLYCEMPGGCHPLPDEQGTYQVTATRSALARIAPYLKALIPLLSAGLPTVGPVLGLTAALLDARIRADVQRIRSLTASVEPPPQAGPDAELSEATTDAVRELLRSVDPEHRWGGLAPVDLPDGTVAHLCVEHRVGARILTDVSDWLFTIAAHRQPFDAVDISGQMGLLPAITLLPHTDRLTLITETQDVADRLAENIRGGSVREAGTILRQAADVVVCIRLLDLPVRRWELGTMLLAESHWRSLDETEIAVRAFLRSLCPGAPFAVALHASRVISEEALRPLFEPFVSAMDVTWHGTGATPPRRDGSGNGVHLIKGIMES